jgi:hypothetical protein
MPEFPEMPEPPQPAPEASIEAPADAPPEALETAVEPPVDGAGESDPEPQSWDPPETEPSTRQPRRKHRPRLLMPAQTAVAAADQSKA